MDNPTVRAGLTPDGITWAFSERHGANWHPVTWLAHMLDFELLGEDPGRHHAAAVAWHALCTLLLFALLVAGTGRAWPSAVVAALFAIHPLHVESVAWVAERKDLVSTALALGAMCLHLAWVRRGAAWRRLGVCGLMALSLMAKPTYVTLPLLLIVLDLWPLGRSDAKAMVREKIPLFGLSVAGALATLGVQGAGGAMSAEIPLFERLSNAATVATAYLSKTVWPADLSFHYPHPSLPGGTPLGAGEIATAAAVLVAISAGVLWSRRRDWIAGWLWYGVALAPTIGLVQVGTQAMADRYTYLPLVGPFWMFAFGLAALWDRTNARPARAVAAALAVGAVAASTWVASQRVPAWRDSEALLRHSLPATPDNPLILNNLAWLLATHPDPARRDPDRAVELARTAVSAARTTDAGYVDTLAVALAARGEFATAARVLRDLRNSLPPDTPEEVRQSVDARLGLIRARRVPRDSIFLRLARDPARARPDLVVVSIDTLGQDALAPGVADRPETPHLDRLASEGLVFTRAMAPSSWTLPSHASLLTGTYPSRHGATAPKTRVRRDAPSLAAALGDAGYETVAFTDGGYMDPEFGLANGFDRYDDPPIAPDGATEGEAPAYERGVALLASRTVDDPPLFLLLHSYRVHDYFTLHPEAVERAGVDADLDRARLEDCLVGAETCDEATWSALAALYRAEIADIDERIGRLLAAIERSGRAERTVVVLTSDHGEGFDPARGRIHHGGRLHRDVLAVPLVFRGPGVVGGASDAPVSLVDVAPTLLDHVGLPTSEAFEGESLSPALSGGEGPPESRPIFASEYHYVWRDGQRASAESVLDTPLAIGVVSGPWWYVKSVDGEELYHVGRDPHLEHELTADGDGHDATRQAFERKYLGPRWTVDRSGEPDPAARSLSPELRERLRALGYAD